MKTTTKWISGMAFNSNYNNAEIEIDGKNGFSPKALLLSGLAACSGIDVVMILEKMRVPFADLVIDVETEQTDTEPKVFKDITMIFKVKGDEENRDKFEKAINLSLEKYCGVSAMLEKHSKINHRLILQQENI